MTASQGEPGDRDLRTDALAIWRAGVRAVDAALLVQQFVRRTRNELQIGRQVIDLAQVGRICVVGGGKAGALMATGLEQALDRYLVATNVTGLLNVPANCLLSLEAIELHPGRPAGVNEPTAEGVAGAERMLEMVGQLGPDDLCIVLLSGGASALLPAPAAGISLSDKLAVTRFLSRAGADIRQLNCVRKQLSRIKGGRLASACRAGRLIALIISDIVGDPLEIIGSGPTVPDPSTRQDALAVLRTFDPDFSHTPANVVAFLEQAAANPGERASITTQVSNQIIGNNLVALSAAEVRARQLGYDVVSIETNVEGVAADLGRDLARHCRSLAADRQNRPRCVLSGGEPVVRVEPSTRPQKGGRNQELALAALTECWNSGMAGFCILSGGTDGEDGPTDAAGALADQTVIDAARRLSLDPAEFLSDHNSYEFFDRTGALLKTGPTHTNVMDVRVALVSR